MQTRRPWKHWEKITFRFFFSFLTLQVFTQDFLGNLFGGARFMWALGDRVFTRPSRGDTLRPRENDTVCWRWWSERTTGGKRYVTIIIPTKLNAGKTYTVSRDTAKGMRSLRLADRKDSSFFCYMDVSTTTWEMEGMWGQNRVRVEFQRVDPDTIFQLLRIKRTVIVLNDDKDQ